MSLDGDIGRVWVIWGLYGARCFGIWQIWVKERAPSLDTKGQTLSPARSGKTFPFSGEPRELIIFWKISLLPVSQYRLGLG